MDGVKTMKKTWAIIVLVNMISFQTTCECFSDKFGKSIVLLRRLNHWT